MANVKFYQVKKEIGGREYTAQFNGLSAYLRMIDQSHNDSDGTVSAEKLHSSILRDVIVEPKGLTPDDFDDFEVLDAVTSWGRKVAQGQFRSEAK